MDHFSEKENQQIELSRKEKVLEIIAVGMCFLLLLASFMKVIFF
jgi:hypothetical protein